jgi:hypothetical protein
MFFCHSRRSSAADASQLNAGVKGLPVFRRRLLQHRFVEVCRCKQLLQLPILNLHHLPPLCRLRLHPSQLASPALACLPADFHSLNYLSDRLACVQHRLGIVSVFHDLPGRIVFVLTYHRIFLLENGSETLDSSGSFSSGIPAAHCQSRGDGGVRISPGRASGCPGCSVGL